jgi:hypothetical protein
MAERLKPRTRRILLELAIADLVALVRPVVERNRRGTGTPSPAVAALALALDRFDRLGGDETLSRELLDDPADRPDTADQCGALRLVPAAGTAADEAGGRTAAARSGRDRLAAPSGGGAPA